MTPEKKHGFTIVEVMVFLAVSGLIFLIAAQFINGKQTQVEFTQGMNNANLIVRAMIDNVANGNYPWPSHAYLQCNGGSPAGFTSYATQQPVSVGCSMIGEVMAPETNGNPYEYSLYPVVGCQYASCNNVSQVQPTTLADIEPNVVSQMIQSSNWPGEVKINSMYVVSTSGHTSAGAFGVFATLPQDSGGGILQNGSQPTQAIELSSITSVSPDDKSQILTEVNNAAPLPANDYILMCFEGPNNKKASITIGGLNGGGQLTTSLGLANGADPLC